jgi:opine dehydrogenase
VATPTTSSLIDLAGTINGVNYRAIGLTLDKMGLRGMGPKQIIEYVRTGTSTASR